MIDFNLLFETTAASATVIGQGISELLAFLAIDVARSFLAFHNCHCDVLELPVDVGGHSDLSPLSMSLSIIHEKLVLFSIGYEEGLMG